MKAIYIGLFLFVFLDLSSQEFLKPGNQWLFETTEYIGPGVINYQKIDSITVTSDTMINGMLYYKLEATEEHLCWVFREVEYLREEGKKIFRLSPDLQSEDMIIDFEETDSYEMTIYYLGNFPVFSEAIIDSFGIVTSFNGVDVNTQHMHILNNESFDDDTPYAVYENIGFINPGILMPDIGTGLCDVFFATQEFKCHISETDTIQWTDRGCFEFPIIDSVDDQAIEEVMLKPNPVLDQLILPTDYQLSAIFNARGQKVVSNVVNGEINMGHLEAGIYYVICQHRIKAKQMVTRVVKM